MIHDTIQYMSRPSADHGSGWAGGVFCQATRGALAT